MVVIVIVEVKGVDDFIGTTFPTPKGGVLTVVSDKGQKGSKKRYDLTCSICSKDVELFPEGFKGIKGNLVKGQIPCGCAKIPKWNECQYKIKVQRECKKRGYVFHGWVGEFRGVHTKLDLENPKTGNKWGSTGISDFMQGRGDPEEKRLKVKEANTVDDNVHIKGFHDAGFTSEYKFTRNTERVCSRGYCRYWDYTCPICSKDEYVKAGVCSGVFPSQVGNLKNGRKACRCGRGYLWTQEQREYQIQNVCREEGLTFIGWGNENVGYKNYRSEFKWVCSEGHDCKTSVDCFLNNSVRCMTCEKVRRREQGVLYGYYLERTQEADSLYILNFDNQYIKVGRSFQIDVRINQLKKESGIPNIELLHTMKGLHQEIYTLEQLIHNKLRAEGFEYKTEWGSIECFTLDSLDSVCKLISEETNNKSTIY